MNDIIQRLRSAYTENPASALKLIPEVLQAADEGLVVELPYPVFTEEQLNSVPRLDREALEKRIRKAESAEKALKERGS